MHPAAELLALLGGISPERVVTPPAPGLADESDVLRRERQPERCLCELVQGTLLLKGASFAKARLVPLMWVYLDGHQRPANLGVVSGALGGLRLRPGLIRRPDAAFTSWDRFPDRRVPRDPIPDLVPDLVAEFVVSDNTPAEMRLKRQDYFQAGCRLVWEIDPDARTATVYTQVDPPDAVLTVADTLVGDPVLAGFALPLADLFAELDRHG